MEVEGVGDDGMVAIVIHRKVCLELSGHYQFWKHQDHACDANPGFMNSYCRLTCRVCSEEENEVVRIHDEEQRQLWLQQEEERGL